MFESLRRKLGTVPHASPAEDRRLAAAVLLLEVARADAEHHALELDTLRAGLMQDFGLEPAAMDALLADAQRRAHETVSLHGFLATLNREMQREEKVALLHLLWRVAHADGRVDAHEEHLIRRLADLLHLPHAEFIRGKLAAQPPPS